MVRNASYGPQPGRGGQPQGRPARRTKVSWEGGWASTPVCPSSCRGGRGRKVLTLAAGFDTAEGSSLGRCGAALTW